MIYLSAGKVCDEYSPWGPCYGPCGQEGYQVRSRICRRISDGKVIPKWTQFERRSCINDSSPCIETPPDDGERCDRDIRSCPVMLLNERLSSLNG